MRVILRARKRAKPRIPIEAEAIIPQNFLRKNDMTVYEGNKERKLEDLFFVTIEGPAVSPDQVEAVLTGETGTIKRVGEYMNAGRTVVEGDIGMHCGNFMSAGEIVIKGNADAWLAREMRGGKIICAGKAGHYCAAGYRPYAPNEFVCPKGSFARSAPDVDALRVQDEYPEIQARQFPPECIETELVVGSDEDVSGFVRLPDGVKARRDAIAVPECTDSALDMFPAIRKGQGGRHPADRS